MKNKSISKLGTSLLVVLGLAAVATAATITPGFTYSVASDGNAPATGSHFHSNTGGAFGNPAGKAEVGGFSSEEVRGLSEYNLAGLVAGPAFVTFNVFNDGGLFAGTNDFPFAGLIDVYSYQGNNTEDISDYQASPASLVGSFSTVGLSVGDTISLNIGAQYNSAISDSWSSLGIRLQTNGGAARTQGGAWTFDSFQLTTDDQSTNRVPDVGSTAALLGAAMFGIAAVRRKLKLA